MTAPPIQAGIRVFLMALILPCLLLPGEAKTATGPTFGPKEKTKAEDVLSLDDILQGAEDLVPSIAPKDDAVKAVPLKTPAEEKKAEEKKDSAKTPPDVPVTKTPAPAPAAAKTAPAPYRVYPSPYVPDSMPYSSSPAGKSETPPLAGPAMAPVTGMIRQFFPILPLGAPPDMPPQYLPLASNRDLALDHGAVTHAIVFVHDITRNASEGLAMLTTLAGTDNETTLILAPQFPLEVDITRFLPYLPNQGQDVARWPAGANSGWQTGEDSLARPPQKGISSFTAIDLVLLYLADRGTFPALQQVTLAGHGMGADFVQRYAAIGQAPAILMQQGLRVRFLAANASSYLYFTGVRPSAGGPSFGMPDTTQCASVNSYPYGLNQLVPYARRSGGDAIRLRYPERKVMFLLSEKITTDPYLDAACGAAAQGRDRLARGRNYERYLAMSFGDAARATQSFIMVPSAAYDPVALFGSYCGLALLFGDGECKPGAKPNLETRPRY